MNKIKYIQHLERFLIFLGWLLDVFITIFTKIGIIAFETQLFTENISQPSLFLNTFQIQDHGRPKYASRGFFGNTSWSTASLGQQPQRQTDVKTAQDRNLGRMAATAIDLGPPLKDFRQFFDVYFQF